MQQFFKYIQIMVFFIIKVHWHLMLCKRLKIKQQHDDDRNETTTFIKNFPEH